MEKKDAVLAALEAERNAERGDSPGLAALREEIAAARYEAQEAKRKIALLSATPATQEASVVHTAPGGPNWIALVEKAPAWLTIIVAAVIGYATLNTRVSTLEYQAQISISDRGDLRRRMDENEKTQSQLRSDISEIKANVQLLITKFQSGDSRK